MDKSGCRLCMVGAELLALLPVLAAVMLFNVYFYLCRLYPFDGVLLGIAEGLTVCLVFAMTLCLFLPMWQGTVYLGYRVSRGEPIALTDVFYPFTRGKRYLHSIVFSLRAIVSIFLLAFFDVAICLLCFFLIPNVWVSAVVSAILICLLDSGAAFLLLGRFDLMYRVFEDETLTLKDLRSICRANVASERKNGVRFLICRLPSFLLGIVTFGVCLFLFTVPDGAVIYALWCRDMSNDEITQ